MNNPSPLIPQGSLLEQKNQSRAKVKVAFFCVVGVHVAAILIALLAQGCKREQTPAIEPVPAPATNNEANLPPLDTNPPPQAAVVTSNPPAQTLPPQTLLPDPVTAPPATGAQEYVIKKGDTFATLAPRFHVTTKAIQAANPTVNPSKLQINQKIAIPAPTTPTAPGAASGAIATPAAASTADAGHQTYIVKSGDTLTKIAKEFHTTAGALRKGNSLKTDKIKVGSKLKVTAKAAPAAPAAPAEPAAAPAAVPTSTPPATTVPPR